MSLASKLPWNHRFAGGYPGLSSQPLPTDADAIDYLSRMATADGAGVEVGVATAINAFFRYTKASGVFNAIKASCILCGARTLNGALVPLAGAAPANNNFISDDYTRGGATPGLKGDGSTKRLSQVNTATPLQNSAHQAVYLSANSAFVAPSLATHVAEWPTSGTAGRTQIDTNTSQTFTRCRETTGSSLGSTSLGVIGISRSDSAGYVRRVGQANATITEASTGIPEQVVYVFNNSSGSYSDARLAFYSIGESLDLEALDDAVSTLVTAIGAAV